MRIVVIGLGSMGRRRIRLIQKYDPSYEIIGVDLNSERCRQVETQFGIRTYLDLSELLEEKTIHCAFISTAPMSHSRIITTCLGKNIHVFTELNLVSDGYDENISLANQRGCVLFLSSTFLYREEIKYMKKEVEKQKKLLNYTYHIGQYLPDWHPWESYKDFFVEKKETNGCREILAIELPWLEWVFGKIKRVNVMKNKITELDIDYEDSYLILAEHDSGHKGSLAVDIVSRKAVRNLEIYGESLYLDWNGSPSGLYQYDLDKKENVNVKLYSEIDHLEGYSSQIIENIYYTEIESFFATINQEEVPQYSFEKDLEILRLIDKIEGI